MPIGLPLPAGVTRQTGATPGIAHGEGPDRLLRIAPSAGFRPPTEVPAEAWLAAARASADVAAVSAGRATVAPAIAAVASADHSGTPPQPRVTVLADVPLAGGPDAPVLFGSDLGFTVEDPADGSRTQAVIEFHGYGMCLLSIAGQEAVELWVAEPGGKVAVQTAPTHVTLYNLDDARTPLVALTAFDGRRTRFSDAAARASGPILSAHYVPNREAVLTFNAAYIDRPGVFPGVKTATPPTDAERTVRIPLRAGLEIGAHIYSELFNNPDIVRAFVRLNVRVLPAPGGVELGPAPGEKADLRDRRNLIPAIAPGRPLHKRLYGG
jgi:hypothetical protein